jgi:trimethylamine-N-oxide reductase (cytochrome c)
MVRRAWLEKGPGASPETRGKGDFVRVSWDAALDLVAKEIRRVQTEFGPWAVFAGTYGWRSNGRVHNCQPWLRRVMNLAGGFVAATGDYSAGASQVVLPYVLGTLEVYEQQTAYPVVLQNTELMVFWGGEPSNNNQIATNIPDHLAYGFIDDLKKSGKKIIFIDPVRTEPCKELGAEWIAVRPQTDVAMMLGIAHTLVAEKLHDTKFLATYTAGFEPFRAYLMGENDGTPKTAEWASAICGVPADTIRDLAHRFAKSRTLLTSGWSMQRQHHGEQVHWMLVTLAAMLGQIGLPGGGFGLSYHYHSGGAPSANAAILPGGVGILTPANTGKNWTDEKGSKTIPCARIVDMLEHPGESFQFNGTVGKYPDVRLTYWVGGNPFHHHQDRNRQVAAWKKFETFIIHDFEWTASARMADIVLPATTTAERNDLDMIGSYTNVGMLAMKQVVAPVGEARNDYDIFRGVAQRLGFEQAFTEGRDEMAWARLFYDGAVAAARSRGVSAPDFDTFWKNGSIDFTVPDAAKKFVKYGTFRDDPLLNPLGTASGKIEITSLAIGKMGYQDCPAHPTWMEPFERASAPDAKYKLHVDTKHPARRLHSQLCGTSLRDGYAVKDREPCLMNPADASARGIADGDVVRVFNDRGQILAGAKISEDVMPGVVLMNEGGWYDPLEPGKPGTLCRYGDVNVLTRDIGTSKLAQATSAATIAAEVEKFTGPLPPVTAFTAPVA